MNLAPASELEGFDLFLAFHLNKLLERFKMMKPEDRDWSPNVAAPSARIIVEHTWQWLLCDRQHIMNPYVASHSDVAEAPASDDAFCEAFSLEIKEWRDMLASMDPKLLDEPRLQFGLEKNACNIRYFLGHTLQNVTYKSGQLSLLFFALGYDGPEQYSAPFPNEIYTHVRQSSGTTIT